MGTFKLERELTSNTNYIEWIIQFLQDRNFFVDKDFLLNSYKGKGFNRDNVLLIGKFYDEVEQYAWEHNIYPQSTGDMSWYGIVYNSFHITISRSLDNCYLKSGLMHACWKVREDELEQNDDTFFIDFNDILENKTPDSLEKNQKVLQDISNYLLSQSASGEIPFRQLLGAIYRTTEQMIDEYDGPKLVKKLIQEKKQ